MDQNQIENPRLLKKLPSWLTTTTIMIYVVVAAIIYFFNAFISLPVYRSYETYSNVYSVTTGNYRFVTTNLQLSRTNEGKTISATLYPDAKSSNFQINGKISFINGNKITIITTNQIYHPIDSSKKIFLKFTVLYDKVSIFKKIKHSFMYHSD